MSVVTTWFQKNRLRQLCGALFFSQTGKMSRARFGVLAFGDSLTQGWHHHGLKKHPYALKLQELVDAAFGEKTFGIVALGVPGEYVKYDRT